MALKEDYKDAVFAGLRKYKMLDNGDGTVSPVDMTEYEAAGDKFGAKDVNAITKMVNCTGDAFDPGRDYEVGDYTIYDNTVWKFTTAHPAGEWDESQMEETDVLTELAEQNKNFGALTENLTWKKVGEVTGTASLALPSAFSELLVTVGSTIFYIPSILLDDTEKSYYYGKVASNGHYLSLGNNTVFVSKTNIRMTSINVENTSSVAIGSYKNITSSTTMTVYYR